MYFVQEIVHVMFFYIVVDIVVEKIREAIRRAICPIFIRAESVCGNGRKRVAGWLPCFIHYCYCRNCLANCNKT